MQKRRAILVPVNVELKGELLAHQLRDSAPKLIITDRDIAELSTIKVESVEGIVRIGKRVAKTDDKSDIVFETLCRDTDPGSSFPLPRTTSALSFIPPGPADGRKAC